MEKLVCPDKFDKKFMIELVKYLGGDASIIKKGDFGWREFGKFQHLRKKAEKYFETAETGDPVWAAFQMYEECGSSVRWVMKVIKNAKLGDPGYVASLMCYHGAVSRKWAERVIENVQVGDPAWDACLMVQYCGSTREWAERVIENVKIGDRASAAYHMYVKYGSPLEWVEQVVKDTKTGDRECVLRKLKKERIKIEKRLSEMKKRR